MDAPPPNRKDALHLIKLCVGTESVGSLAAWRAQSQAERIAAGLDPRPRHVTRMWPRRAGELLQGGSLYWVIKGVIIVRQRIAALEPVTGIDGITRCAIVFEPELIRTVPRPRRPFQGWRYLSGADAPPDLTSQGGAVAELPEAMRAELVRLGILGG